MKYIVVRTPGGEAPVLFPRAFLHRYVADRLKPLEVVAAGFVDLADGRVRCHGASAGLRLSSRPERDSGLIMAELDKGEVAGGPAEDR